MHTNDAASDRRKRYATAFRTVVGQLSCAIYSSFIDEKWTIIMSEKLGWQDWRVADNQDGRLMLIPGDACLPNRRLFLIKKKCTLVWTASLSGKTSEGPMNPHCVITISYWLKYKGSLSFKLLHFHYNIVNYRPMIMISFKCIHFTGPGLFNGNNSIFIFIILFANSVQLN